MQFIANGPDIPNELLFEHEDGNVVFFCGAGISYPASLKDFADLTKRLYELSGLKDDLICRFIEKNQYDRVIELIERNINEGRLFRRHLNDILKPNYRLKNATRTHYSLLNLSKTRDGKCRLVTTNFDKIFQYVIKKRKSKIPSYEAPLLPIPKNSKWNGIVYLHGLLPENCSDHEGLNKLVLSSGDFGLAYLTERWASRFVSELFRNYTVCFVGYSIEDPIIRYMMDALAADSALGENKRNSYAFAAYEDGEREKVKKIWDSKGVTPILYSDENNHIALHNTLKSWESIYSNGLDGRQEVVISSAGSVPSKCTDNDDFVGRMLWALSDNTGKCAECFSKINPAPPIEWLDEFSKRMFSEKDFFQFGITCDKNISNDVKFSLINRPPSHLKMQWISFFKSNQTYTSYAYTHWDKMMYHLTNWIFRYLDNPKIVYWIIENGGVLHPEFAHRLRAQLDFLSNIRTEEKEILLRESPSAIPRDEILKALLIISRGLLSWQEDSNEIFCVLDIYKKSGVNVALKQKLRKFLTPKISIRKHIDFSLEVTKSSFEEQLFDFNVVVSASYVVDEIRNIKELASLYNEFQLMLEEALALAKELGQANEKSDRSFWSMPSISPHRQNDQHMDDWSFLIELVRDAWLDIAKSDLEKAHRIALNWFQIPYFTFKRLALYAACKDQMIASSVWIDWILSDNGWLLWFSGAKRETMRLLRLRVKDLTSFQKEKLEEGILKGPSRSYYDKDMPDKDWRYIRDYSIWHRLAKIMQGGVDLGVEAQKKYKSLSARYPKWKLDKKEKDEFVSWISGTGDPDYEEEKVIERVPADFNKFLKWLRTPIERHFNSTDDFSDVCKKHPVFVIKGFYQLLKKGNVSESVISRINNALWVWSEDGHLLNVFWVLVVRYGDKVFLSDKKLLEKISKSLAWCMEKNSITRYEQTLIDLCKDILDFQYNVKIRFEGSVGDINTDVINHQVGLITSTLVNLWFKTNPKENEGLSGEYGELFTWLSDNKIRKFLYAKLIMAQNVLAFYRVDKSWAKKFLIPLFNWSSNKETATVMWAGFFVRNVLDVSLMAELKEYFLLMVREYSKLSCFKDNIVRFMTYMAIYRYDCYSEEEFKSVFYEFPIEALEEVSRTILQMTESVLENNELFWTNSLNPFWTKIWPKRKMEDSEVLSEMLVRICLSVGDKIGEAFRLMSHCVTGIKYPYRALYRLKDSEKILKAYPEIILDILSHIVTEKSEHSNYLKNILEKLKEAKPELARDRRFQDLIGLI